MDRPKCPKCGSPNSRYERTYTDLIQVCMCGYRKTVFTTLDELEPEQEQKTPPLKLPRADSNLLHTLVCLRHIAPANSQEVTHTLIFRGHSFTVSDVSSYLMMLKTRGLVKVKTYRRGVLGGSEWEMSEGAIHLLDRSQVKE